MSLLRIAIVGPECSGKTTLASHLSQLLNEPMVPEFSRMYFAGRKYEYHPEDILNIARGQEQLEKHHETFANKVLICDTNNLVNWVWSEYRYGNVPELLKATYQPQRYALHLLCKPDVPWETDPLRENAEKLEEIYNHYLSLLHAGEIPFASIEGDFLQRYQMAIAALESRILF